MQNAEGGSVSARSNDRYDGFGSIMLDILDRARPSKAQGWSSQPLQSKSPLEHHEIAANVVVLDDAAPRYLNARAALNTAARVLR
jgi:hypothetical protein